MSDDIDLPPSKGEIIQRRLNYILLAISIPALYAGGYSVMQRSVVIEKIEAANSEIASLQEQITSTQAALAQVQKLQEKHLSRAEEIESAIFRLQERAVQIESYPIMEGNTGHETCLVQGYTCGFVLSVTTVDRKTEEFSGWQVNTCDSKIYRSYGELVMSGKHVRGPKGQGRGFPNELWLRSDPYYMAQCITSPTDQVVIPEQDEASKGVGFYADLLRGSWREIEEGDLTFIYGRMAEELRNTPVEKDDAGEPIVRWWSGMEQSWFEFPVPDGLYGLPEKVYESRGSLPADRPLKKEKEGEDGK